MSALHYATLLCFLYDSWCSFLNLFTMLSSIYVYAGTHTLFYSFVCIDCMIACCAQNVCKCLIYSLEEKVITFWHWKSLYPFSSSWAICFIVIPFCVCVFQWITSSNRCISFIVLFFLFLVGARVVSPHKLHTFIVYFTKLLLLLLIMSFDSRKFCHTTSKIANIRCWNMIRYCFNGKVVLKWCMWVSTFFPIFFCSPLIELHSH